MRLRDAAPGIGPGMPGPYKGQERFAYFRNGGLRRLWLALPLAVYLLLPTRNYYWDGVAFAINVEKQLPLRETLHPNHLIYTAALVWLYRAALLIGIETRALFLMQFVNSLLAAAGVALVYRALRRRAIGMEGAIAGALAFAFAATWWKFSTDADAYIPSIFLLLCANDLLETRRSVVLAGVTHAAAMLFHELAILFLPVALWRLKEPKQRLSYAACSLGPTGMAYVLAYRVVCGQCRAAGLAGWVMAHSPDASFSWQPMRDLGLTLAGTLRLFFGGRLDQAAAWPFAIIGAIAVAACLVGLAVGWKRGGPLRFRVPPGDLLLWAGVYVAFLFVWMPQNTFYRLFYLAPLVVGACCAVERIRVEQVRADRLLPWMLCGVLFLWNLVFAIYPQSRVENNVALRFAIEQHEHWPPGTPIAFHNFHPDLWTISYFNPQVAWIGLDKMDLDRLERSLEDARQRGQPLWLEATAYEFLSADPAGRRWLASHPAPALLRFRDSKHEFRFYAVR
ncbi:MAG: hypothetical protein ABSE42_12440 [Bryobacteraceae bacterium]|jgi:hypothetical protein